MAIIFFLFVMLTAPVKADSFWKMWLGSFLNMVVMVAPMFLMLHFTRQFV